MKPQCPFCNIAVEKILLGFPGAIALRDTFPVADGHTLVVPRQHVISIFDLANSQRAELWEVVAQVRSTLVDQLSPDGFNIGINEGAAAGQTVTHAHVHVIPRFNGDVADPRGGVRWVIPEKAVYWGSRP